MLSISQLTLDFTVSERFLDSTETIELKEGGTDILITEENKEEYLAELDKIRAAEEWIENNKVTEQPIKPVINNDTSNGELLVQQEPSKPNTFLYLILLFMASLFVAIIFVPEEDLNSSTKSSF